MGDGLKHREIILPHEKKFKTHLVLKHITRLKAKFDAKKCLKHTGCF